MRTPTGSECRYYYADFHRGNSVQECRLLSQAVRSLPWRPQVCQTCPVPAILRANNCPHMTLGGRLARRWFRERVLVEAFCTQAKTVVANPYVGCGRCVRGPATVFVVGESAPEKE